MIPYKLAYDAHRGTSFSPEDRAKQTQEGFVTHIETTYRRLLMLDENRKEEIETDIDVYAEGYAKKEIALLRAKSNCVSTMIAGPSNFNVARAEKKNDIAHKRLQETIEWSDYQIKKLNNKYKKVVKKEADEILAYYRKGINDGAAKTLMKNSCANKLLRIVKDDKERIDEVKAAINGATDLFTSRHSIHKELKELELKSKEQTMKEEINGVEVIDNIEDCRIQLFFDGKPDQEIIDYLKKNSWKWTPSKGCWQNYREKTRLEKIKEYLRCA